MLNHRCPSPGTGEKTAKMASVFDVLDCYDLPIDGRDLGSSLRGEL